MRRILKSSLAGIAAIVVVFTLSTAGLDRLPPNPAEYTCRLPATSTEPYRVLVVGESWAAGDRLLPELPEVISERLHGRTVQVCTMAFSGKNTARVYLGIKREGTNGGLQRAFHGASPDAVILLNGVNDQIQHVGTERYVEDTENVATLFKSANFQVVSAPSIHPAGNWWSSFVALRSAAKRVLFDHGQDDVTAEYRAALAVAHPELPVISYSDFLPDFKASSYRPDGIHLTPLEFHRYGRFLGERVSLQ